MNEEMIKALYEKLGLNGTVDYNKFRSDIEGNPAMQKAIYDKLRLQSKNVEYSQFERDLGASVKTPLHDYFGKLESDNNYQAYNPDGGGQGAVGAYQVRYESHQKDIAKVTGVKNRDEFYSDSYAQDKYMSHLIDQYQQHLPELQKINEERGLGLSDWELMYTEHHEGLVGAKKYLQTGNSMFGSEKALDTMYNKGRKYLKKGDANLISNQGSASAPVSSLINFDSDVDQSKFSDELVKNLYKQNGGQGEIVQAGIQKFNGLFGKYDNTYAISVRDNLGEDKLIKYEDTNSSSNLEGAQNNLIELGGAFANGVVKSIGFAGGALKDLQELITSGDTNPDKMFDYQDNALTKQLTEAYNVNIDSNNYSDSYKKLLEDEQIAKEGGDRLGALGNALSKVFHPEYWKENGLETVGNSLSFMVPGLGLSKVAGASLKGAQALGLGAKGTKFLTETLVYSGLNSALEAGAEGAETFKAAYEHGLKNGMTEEEATAMASDYAAEVAATNMPILMASNALEYLGIGGKLLSAPGAKRFIYNTVATAIPESIQEGLQFGIQDNAKRYETQKYDPSKVGLIDDFSQAMGGSLSAAYKGMMDASPEFYDSITMGGLMGAVFGAPGAAKSTYDYYKVEKPLAKDINSVLANKFSDIYERDSDGNFIDDNGKIKINGSKLQSHLNGLQQERYLAELESVAAAQDNGEAVKMIQGSKISKLIHDALLSGKDVDNIKNAVDQAFTPAAYEDNKLKEHYSFEDYKAFRGNAVKFSEDAYKETYSNPLLAKQSSGFKENVYYNLSQQKMVNNELEKYNSKLELIPEKPTPLQKLEKEDLTHKIEVLTKFKTNLEDAYNSIFKESKKDKKSTEAEVKKENQETEVKTGIQEGLTPEQIIVNSSDPKGAADILKQEADKQLISSLDGLNSKKDYQQAVKSHPHLAKEISDHYNNRIEKQKSVQKDITSAQDLVGRYGEENNLLKEAETESLFKDFKSRLENKENLNDEIKNYETLRNNPNHTFKPDPELQHLGQHILAGGNLDSYASLAGLEHNIADPLLQDSIDGKPLTKVKEDVRKNEQELRKELNDLFKSKSLTKEVALSKIEDAHINKKITDKAKDKLIEDVDKLFTLPDPRIQKLIDLGYTEKQALDAIENNTADELIEKKGVEEVLFEPPPSVITPLFIDTSVGVKPENQNLVQVESTTPDGKKNLHTVEKTVLFSEGGLWSSSKQDLLCKYFNVPDNSTFRIVSQPKAFYEDNLVETNKILSSAKPGDQFYYETDYTYGTTKETFGINIIFYSKDGKIVNKETEGAKKHTAGVVRSSTNPALDKHEKLEVSKLREKLFTGKPLNTPIKLKAVSRKQSLNIGKLRPLTAEELTNSFDVVIANWEDETLPMRFSSNKNVGEPISNSGGGSLKQFHDRMMGKVFMFLKSWDKNGLEKNIPVELETKAVSEVPRIRKLILDALKKVEEQTDEKSAKEESKKAWNLITEYVRLRTPDSSFDAVNKSTVGLKAGLKNPRGGIGPVFTYHFEDTKTKKRGFLTKVKGKVERGWTAEQLLNIIETHRVAVPHNETAAYLRKNRDILLTDLHVNNTQDNQLIFDNSNIEDLIPTKLTEETRAGGRVKPVKFKVSDEITESSQKEIDLSYIKDRFANLGIVVSTKELNKLAEIFGANTGTVWGAFHDAVLFLNENAGTKVQKHEAFHILFNVYLNKEQQAEVLKEAFDKFGKELGITKQEFEEWLNKPTNSGRFKVEDNVNFVLKSVDILSSDDAAKIFDKGFRNQWSLEKILNELHISKEQWDIIKEAENRIITSQKAIFSHKGYSSLPRLIADEILANYGYTVEINTAKEGTDFYGTEDFRIGDTRYYTVTGEIFYKIENDFANNFNKKSVEIDFKEFEKAAKQYKNINEQPTQHYANLTVPGGTNYTENEIATPAITPSIKGHAQFSTSNGIGWFRSDDKQNYNEQDKSNSTLPFIKSNNTIDDDFFIKDELIVTKELQNIKTNNWDGSINKELEKLKNELNQLPVGSRFNTSAYTNPTPTNLEDVLNKITLSESNKVLLEKIKPLIKNIKIEYVDKFILANSGAVYSDKYNTIRINKSEKNIPLEELLMHELLHAATFRKISYFETNTKGLSEKELLALNELENIRKVLKEASDKYWDNKPRYARSVNPLEGYRTDSIHEIISYAFTNKEFRDAIAKIPYKGNKSILDKLVELIANIFGVKQDTILNALLANTEILLENNEVKSIPTKTRRILEVQSDLFQKGRDEKKALAWNRYILDNKGDVIGENPNFQSEQDFLNLLRKDNKWVTFFVKSIIQDSAKKGYEKVLFPRLDTIIQIESAGKFKTYKEASDYYNKSTNWIQKEKELNEEIDDIIKDIEAIKKSDKNEYTYGDKILTKQQELERQNKYLLQAKEERASNRPTLLNTANFYENDVTNILKKQGYNPVLITDEYGNTWNEVFISKKRDISTIKLKGSEEFYKSQNPLIRLEEKLAEMFEDFSVENLGISSPEFKKSYPIISKIFDEIYKFIYDAYRRLKPYFTNKLSIQDIFYQLEKNTFNKKTFEKRLLSHQKVSDYYPKFRITSLTPKEIKKYSRFIATDVLEQALWKYESATVDGEIVIKHQYLTDLKKSKLNEFLERFLSDLDTLVNNHFKQLGNPETGAKIKSALNSDRTEFIKYIIQDINTLYDTHYYLEENEDTNEEKVLLIRETNVNPTENIKGKLKEYLNRVTIREKVNGEYKDVIDPEFGIEKRHDFEQIYNKLLSGLSDNPTPKMFWDRIKDLADNFDWADSIKTSIEQELKVNNFDSETQSKLFRLLFAKTGGMRNINFISETRKPGSSKFYEAGKRNVANEIVAIIGEKYEDDQININGLKSIGDGKKLKKEDVYGLLTSFGFDITEEEAALLFNEHKTYLGQFYNMLHKNINTKDFNPLRIPELGKLTRLIARLIAGLPSKYTMTVLTVKGENEYIHQINNFLTKFFNKSKTESEELYNKAQGALIHKGIDLYDDLRDPVFRNNIKIEYDLGFRYGGEELEYKDFLFDDLLSHDFNAFLTEAGQSGRARVPLPTFSDATNRAYITLNMVNDVARLTVPLVKAEMERIEYCNENTTGYRNFDINGKHFVLFPFLEDKNLFDVEPDLLDEYIEELLKAHIEDRIKNYTNKLIEEGIVFINQKGKLEASDSLSKNILGNKIFAGDISIAIEKYFKQRWYYNTQLIPMLAGDPAFYGGYKSSTDKYNYNKIPDALLKRMKELHSPKEDAIIVDDNGNPKTIRQLVVSDVLKSSLEKELEDFKTINPNYKGDINNITDGQIITSLDFNRQVKNAYGELTDADLEEYEKIKQGRYGNATPGFTKPYYYNLETVDNLLYPLQEKSSEFPLIPAEAFLTKNGKVEFPGHPTDFNKFARPTLAKILWLMTGAGDPNRAFDKVVFESAIKTDIDEAKLVSIDDIINLDFKKIYGSIQSHSAADYGRQQVVPTDKHYNKKQKYGSQARVAITADLHENVILNGKEYTPEEIRELHDSILVANIEEAKTKVAAKFSTLSTFVKTLQEQAVNRNKTVEQLMAYEIQGDGYPAVPIDYPLTSVENQKLANAETKKAIITPTPGGTFVNRTSIDYADDLEIKRIYDENGKAVGIEYVEVAIPAHNSALLLLSDKNGVIDFKRLRETYSDFDKLLEGFGYRIPTEDKYSMYPIRIKYLIPQNSDAAIILPREATGITGLDFDVDKMFVMFRAFNIKKGDFSVFTHYLNSYAKQINLLQANGEPVVHNEDTAKEIFNKMMINEPADNEADRIIMDFIKDDFIELKDLIRIDELGYVEPSMDNVMSRHNLMMDIILAISKTPSFAKSFFEGGSSDILKENIERLKDYPLDQGIPTDVIDPLHQDYNSKKAIVGGNIIGIAAAQNKHHFALQGQDFELKSNFNFLDDESYKSLTKIDGKGGRISKFISAILFASTEHIKNPLLDKLGITLQNVGIFIVGLRLGIPFDQLCTLFRHPAVLNIFKELSKIKFPSTYDFKDYIKKTYKVANKDMPWFLSLETQTLSHATLFKDLSSGKQDYDLIILSKLYRLFDTANDIRAIMSAGKFDTEESFGPKIYDNIKSYRTILGLHLRYKENKLSIVGLENILPKVYQLDDGYYMDSSNLKLNDSYISLIIQQLNSLKSIFGFLSKDYSNLTNKIEKIAGIEEFSVDNLQRAHKGILVAVAQKILKFGSKDIKALNAVFQKIKKQDKNFKEKYPNLLRLLDLKSIKGLSVIRKTTSYKIDKGTTALIKREWAEAMSDPAYSDFARKLAIYSLVTSDFSFGLNTFCQFIPEYDFLTGTQEGKDIREYFKNIADLTKFTKEEEEELAELIILNNPRLTRYIDTEHNADIISKYTLYVNTLIPSKTVVPEIIKLKGNIADNYRFPDSETPLDYIYTNVYYMGTLTPILYKYDTEAEVYKMVILPSNPSVYSVYTKEEKSYYPLKREERKLENEVPADERIGEKMVDDGFFQEPDDDLVERDGFFVPRESVEEDFVEENGFFVPRKSEEDFISEDIEKGAVNVESFARKFEVDQYKISLYPNGKMFFKNGEEVLDQTIQNKVLVQKEVQDKTAKTYPYNGTNYIILSDNRIISEANYQEKTFTESQRDFIIKNAKKIC